MAFDGAAVPKNVTAERVLDMRRWTDELFSFRLSRPASFRFRSGEFVMLGLMVDERPLLRAYSIASPAWDDGLDFYSIKAPGGPLTSRLQNIAPGDAVLLGKKPTGTLVLDALTPGKRLYMLSTGTGIAPFASLLRDPETYETFDQVVLTHTCRNIADLAYGARLISDLKSDPLVGDIAPQKVIYYATTTREDFIRRGRITELISSGKLFDDLKLPPFSKDIDRVMICGSAAMLADTKALVEAAGLEEGSNAAPADFVIERAFAG